MYERVYTYQAGPDSGAEKGKGKKKIALIKIKMQK